ncbi:major facilitator superfamily transporter [Niveomyces insectorum RCEF 264]|uniref:Major facilitator superfamily transporter n=1 Tax=Niveomyces insectorum RCEF 264 TaxID=1081102 RepID=A0A167XXU9_9HYPO|nr:major facilitator superfamily transporter [Niveomyces insectorum RCEF 264]
MATNTTDLVVEPKFEAEHNDVAKGSQFDADVQFVETYDAAKRKAIVRKIDWRLPPFLALLYMMSYLDRSNIANAEIEGILEDLHMTGIQYNVATSLFFVTYIVFEIPSNWVLERYFEKRPSLWIGTICICWGILMTMHGVVHNYGSLLALRLVMGAFEAGYTKFELSARVSIYYAGAAVSGAFSGLLAYGIAHMAGVGGYNGWRWIFLLEGIATVVIGVVVLVFLIDTPELPCSWLSDEEREYCRRRLEVQDGGRASKTSGSVFSWKLLYHVLLDWQIWIMAFVFWSNTIPGYGLKFTMPQIIKNMGFTSSNAQLMTIPPYFCGGVSAYVFGRLSDKFHRRAYFLLIPQMCLVVGFAILFPLAPKIEDHVGPCFFAVILVCIGLYPIQPGSSSWISNNLAGPAKRAIGLAWAFSLTNVGSIGGSYIYIASEAPSYPTGFGCSLGFSLGGMTAVILLSLAYSRINKRRDALDVDQIRQQYSEEELAKMGDRSPLFRYVV